jgi:AcrR family transcriptional regulator
MQGSGRGGPKVSEQRPRGSTSTSAVVNAALSVVDDAGVEGLTIRGVAKRANTPPMSLYTHFTNKEQLLDLMYAEIVRHLYLDADHPTWQAGLRAVCLQIRAVLMQHPRWAPLLSRAAPPMEVPARERLLALMTAHGMAPEAAFATLSSAMLVSIGLVLVEFAFREASDPSNTSRQFVQIKAWVETSSPAAHPVTHAAVSKLSRFDLGDNFQQSIEALIVGLDAKRIQPVGA